MLLRNLSKTLTLSIPLVFWQANVFAGSPKIAVAEEIEIDKKMTTGVRVVFIKEGSAWKTMPFAASDDAALNKLNAEFYTENHEWTVCFDGAAKGKVKSQKTQWKYFSQVGMQELAKGEKSPLSGKRDLTFAGFANEPVMRPLALSVSGNCKDPDLWKPTTTSKEIESSAIQWVVKEMKRRKDLIKGKSEENYPPEINEDTWPIEIDVKNSKVLKAYKSKLGDQLVSLLIKSKDSGTRVETFYVTRKSELQYLGPCLKVLEAADFDADGQSEVMLHQACYNRDGYVLLTNQGQKKLVFEWNYH